MAASLLVNRKLGTHYILFHLISIKIFEQFSFKTISCRYGFRFETFVNINGDLSMHVSVYLQKYLETLLLIFRAVDFYQESDFLLQVVITEFK